MNHVEITQMFEILQMSIMKKGSNFLWENNGLFEAEEYNRQEL